MSLRYMWAFPRLIIDNRDLLVMRLCDIQHLDEILADSFSKYRRQSALVDIWTCDALITAGSPAKHRLSP